MAIFRRLKQTWKGEKYLAKRAGAEGFETDFSAATEYHAGVDSHLAYVGDSAKSAGIHGAKIVWHGLKTVLYSVGAAAQLLTHGAVGVYKDNSWAKKAAHSAGKTVKHTAGLVGNTVDTAVELTGAVAKVVKKPLSKAASKASDAIIDGVDALLPPEGKGATEAHEMSTLAKEAYDLGDLIEDVSDALFTGQVDLTVAGDVFNTGADE